MTTPEQNLLEELAEKAHQSWAHWMTYLFLQSTRQYDGSYVIPKELVERWQRQVETPYAQLSEKEKESDREEARHILPIINGYWEGNEYSPELAEIIFKLQKA